MRIVSWNVNSINSRKNIVHQWIKENKPDIINFQETKCTDENLPKEIFEDLGYNIAFSGQKSYNGVLAASKKSIEEVKTSFTNQPNPEHARFLEYYTYADKKLVRILNCYVPNGQEINSDKFFYKLSFLDNLVEYVKDTHSRDEMTIICGDFNVALENLDVYDPKSLLGTIGFHHEERIRLQKLIDFGFVDLFRAFHPNSSSFSWWDYRGNSHNLNKGMRIDYIFVSPLLADKSIICEIDSSVRSLDKPSDHAPVIMEMMI